MWSVPARKPTGTYLAPGTIATVTVPAALVNQNFQIRVGAHSWDNSNRDTIRRLDRSSLLYNIKSVTTKIASPLGGGIYIEVPKGASRGVVNVTMTGAARSPFFSAKSFHQTTLAEWQATERTQPGPWADFQSEKYMFQVPRSWIFAFNDPVTLMANWDKAVDALTDLMGFPQIRGKETLYNQVDLQFRSDNHAPGYPAVNNTYNPKTTYGGNQNHYLLNGPQNVPFQEFHEPGHGFGFPGFAGEIESTVNLLHIAVQTQKFGKSFDQSLRESIGFSSSFVTMPTTAVLWMTSFNFSPREVPMGSYEKAYQPQGHAKFADLARLFGWQGLNDFYYFYNDLDDRGIGYSEATDSLLLQLCKSYGKDVRPMMHFWGLHPENAATLGTSISNAKLKAPVEIYDRIVQYKAQIPTNNAAYQAFCINWYGSPPDINGFTVENEHARQWNTTLLNGTANQLRQPTEEYNEAAATALHARVQEILNLYYPTGRPTDYAAWDANFPGVDLSNPNADLDGDGLTNNEERIWGLDPTSGASSRPIGNIASLKTTGNLTYTRRVPSLTSLNYTVWTSLDLETWTQDTGATQTLTTTVGNVQTITVKLTPALLSQPRIFVRIKASS